MGINVRKNPFLYSASTELAYIIAKTYYKDIHFVWCTTMFNCQNQPPTSNPATICKRYLEQITTGDRHTNEIQTNMVGILRGAKEKLTKGVINKKQYTEIRSLVAGAKYEAFFPVLYIIESKKVKDHCIEVKVSDRASDNAVEYRIEDLKEDEFELISFKNVMNNVVNVVDRRVGE